MVLAVSKEKPFIKVPVEILEGTKAYELQVWVALARHINHKRADNLVYPSQSTIGKIVGMSRIRVNQIIKILIDKRFLEVAEAPKGKPKVYRVLTTVYKGCKPEFTGGVKPHLHKQDKEQDKITMLYKKKPRQWAKSNGQYWLDRINEIPLRKGEGTSANGHAQVWTVLKELTTDKGYLDETLKLSFWKRVNEESKWPLKKGIGNAGYGKRAAITIRKLLADVETEDTKKAAIEEERRKQLERFAK